MTVRTKFHRYCRTPDETPDFLTPGGTNRKAANAILGLAGTNEPDQVLAKVPLPLGRKLLVGEVLR